MSVPQLTVPLVLEAAERIADGMGGFSTIWAPRGVLYAQMQAGSGREFAAEAGAASSVTWRITTRAFRESDPRRPRPEQRFRMGARVFRIEAVSEQGPAGRWLTAFAKEEKLA